ncbi:MAG TPA: FMN-binding negative transcriptional regulator [Candidatus Binatia bacterium]
MYLPGHFEETRIDILHQLIRARPLATIVTLGSAGLNANHIPFELSAEPAPLGTLRGHVARANPLWRDFSENIDALIIFHGPQAYVSPSWYPTKQATGEVVPTYNYIVVHAYGRLQIIDDPRWLRGLVTHLTERFEAARAEPWHVTDAPDGFIENQLRAIVGIEIVISKLLGKWKASQNRPVADREGVVKGLSESNDADCLALAELVRERSKM